MNCNWEYKTTDKQRELNELGRKGWECYAVTEHSDDRGNYWITFYLKRPLK